MEICTVPVSTAPNAKSVSFTLLQRPKSGIVRTAARAFDMDEELKMASCPKERSMPF